MPEHEFERYLNLLAKLLKLNTEQRDAIAAEFRDHMETRLEELTEEGMPRADAITQALNEFGDTSALAHDIAQPVRAQKRRRITQTSFGTMAACAAVTTAIIYLAPGTTTKPSPQSIALGNKPSNQQINVAQNASSGKTIQGVKTIQTVLSSTMLDKIDFNGYRLASAIQYLSEKTNTNIIVDWVTLEYAGIDQDTPVTFNAKQMPARETLRYILELSSGPKPNSTLQYRVDENAIVISTRSQIHNTTPTTRSYNANQAIARMVARDLLVPIATFENTADPMTKILENVSTWTETQNPNAAPQAIGSEQARAYLTSSRTKLELNLLTAIRDTHGTPLDWVANGGDKASAFFIGGTILINAPESIHAEIEETLHGAFGITKSSAPTALTTLTMTPEDAARISKPISDLLQRKQQIESELRAMQIAGRGDEDRRVRARNRELQEIITMIDAEIAALSPEALRRLTHR